MLVAGGLFLAALCQDTTNAPSSGSSTSSSSSSSSSGSSSSTSSSSGSSEASCAEMHHILDDSVSLTSNTASSSGAGIYATSAATVRWAAPSQSAISSSSSSTSSSSSRGESIPQRSEDPAEEQALQQFLANVAANNTAPAGDASGGSSSSSSGSGSGSSKEGEAAGGSGGGGSTEDVPGVATLPAALSVQPGLATIGQEGVGEGNSGSSSSSSSSRWQRRLMAVELKGPVRDHTSSAAAAAAGGGGGGWAESGNGLHMLANRPFERSRIQQQQAHQQQRRRQLLAQQNPTAAAAAGGGGGAFTAAAICTGPDEAQVEAATGAVLLAANTQVRLQVDLLDGWGALVTRGYGSDLPVTIRVLPKDQGTAGVADLTDVEDLLAGLIPGLGYNLGDAAGVGGNASATGVTRGSGYRTSVAGFTGEVRTLLQEGTAAFSNLILHALPGSEHRLQIRLEAPGLQLQPYVVPLQVQLCPAGSVPQGNTRCSLCVPPTFSFLAPSASTTIDWSNSTSSSSEQQQCVRCPAYGQCHYGLLVPSPGVLQPHPRSVQLQPCPNQQACSYGPERQQSLLAYQCIHKHTMTFSKQQVQEYIDLQCAPGYTGAGCGSCQRKPLNLYNLRVSPSMVHSSSSGSGGSGFREDTGFTERAGVYGNVNGRCRRCKGMFASWFLWVLARFVDLGFMLALSMWWILLQVLGHRVWLAERAGFRSRKSKAIIPRNVDVGDYVEQGSRECFYSEGGALVTLGQQKIREEEVEGREVSGMGRYEAREGVEGGDVGAAVEGGRWQLERWQQQQEQPTEYEEGGEGSQGQWWQQQQQREEEVEDREEGLRSERRPQQQQWRQGVEETEAAEGDFIRAAGSLLADQQLMSGSREEGAFRQRQGEQREEEEKQQWEEEEQEAVGRVVVDESLLEEEVPGGHVYEQRVVQSLLRHSEVRGGEALGNQGGGGDFRGREGCHVGRLWG